MDYGPRIVVLLAIMVAGGGCRKSGRPETAPVHGRVILQGQPIVDATVTFLGDRSPRLAVGKTDRNGEYVLETFEENDGAVLGWHAVTVYKPALEIQPVAVDPTLSRDQYLAFMEQAAARALEAQQAGSSLPQRYADPRTTPLRKEVVQGDNQIDLDLLP